MPTRILIVADDIGWRSGIETCLRPHHFAVVATCGAVPLPRAITSTAFDIVLIGATPETLQTLRRMRAIGKLGSRPHVVVMAMAHDDGDCTPLLDGGADDYFPLTYTPQEIVARLNAIQRRRTQTLGRAPLPEAAAAIPALRFGDWVLDLGSAELHAPCGTHVPLTRHESKILSKLVVYPDAVHSRDDLTYGLTGQVGVTYRRTTDTTVSRLRRKLATYAAGEVIATVPRRGYKLALPVQPAPE